jgi:hypothetical protein
MKARTRAVKRPHTTQSMTQRLPNSIPGTIHERKKHALRLFFRYSRGETTRKPVRSDSKL